MFPSNEFYSQNYPLIAYFGNKVLVNDIIVIMTSSCVFVRINNKKTDNNNKLKIIHC